MAETENKGDVKTEPTPESTAESETTAEPTSESAAETTPESTAETTPESTAETTAEPTALERKIYQQVEYYFGDHNLTRDRFLQGEIKKDDGWVALETLVKFNRLKALTDDFGVICAALQKSPSRLMEVSEDKTKVRRLPSKSLPKNTEQWRSENKARTVYCKGFHQDDTLDVIQQFFQDKGKVETVFMRRNENKEFKGSVFATFSSLDDAKKFVEAEGIQYKGEDVKKMFKNEYFNMKLEEKKKKKEEEKRQLEEETDQLEKKKAEEKQKDVEYTKGCILHFSGAPGDSVREEVSKVFQPFGDVKWIDFNKGDTKRWLMLWLHLYLVLLMLWLHLYLVLLMLWLHLYLVLLMLWLHLYLVLLMLWLHLYLVLLMLWLHLYLVLLMLWLHLYLVLLMLWLHPYLVLLMLWLHLYLVLLMLWLHLYLVLLMLWLHPYLVLLMLWLHLYLVLLMLWLHPYLVLLMLWLHLYLVLLMLWLHPYLVLLMLWLHLYLVLLMLWLHPYLVLPCNAGVQRYSLYLDVFVPWQGTVRFSTPGAAAAAAQEADGKVTLKGEELTCRVLEGEEEKQHWLEVYENQSKVRQQKKKMKFGQGRGRGRGRGRGGRGRYRGDRDHDRNTTFQGKKTRLDSDGEGSDGERQQKMDDTSASAKRRLEESVKEEEPAKKHLKTEAD
ncbi:SSB [Branchiostoma lanceolatum]|uniref:SSB protein n=1 Tax=Branchiostoma lanceolatum TaxID=7740 RepID=A0A8J9Z8S7_BRALA|nr:SSB [Branchiostoma lanceolatum]